MSTSSNNADLGSSNQVTPTTDLAGRVVLVMGAPGSGKGTQCKKLAVKFGLVHISTGDLFREHVERKTDLGLQAKEYLDRKCFVPDELAVNLVRDKLRECAVPELPKFPRGRGALLDGFPRTAGQAEVLSKLVPVDRVLFLDANDKGLVARAPGRRIDSETGEIYHLKFVPPPSNLRNKKNRLVTRDGDDDVVSFQTRLDVFRTQIRRVLPYFSGRVHRVDALQGVDEVFKSCCSVLENPALNVPVANSNGQSVSSGGLCAICFTEPADFLCAPCGHQCGCEECLTAVKNTSGKCPMCREPVRNLQRVFNCGKNEENDEDKNKNDDPQPLRVNDDVSAPKVAELEEFLDGKNAKKAVDEEEWPDDVSDSSVEDVNASSSSTAAPSTPPAGGVEVAVAPSEDIKENCSASEVKNVTVSIKVPENFAHLAEDECVGTDVACVVDVSGSMGSLAVETDGKTNKDGLSILDIVKHALKTVIHQLNPQDRLSVVAFSTNSQVVFELKPMSEEGKKSAVEAVEGMHTLGSTNIWAGILSGMETLREASEEGEAMVPVVKETDVSNANDNDTKPVETKSAPVGAFSKRNKKRNQRKGASIVDTVKGIFVPAKRAEEKKETELVKKSIVSRRKTLLLLTDGQPNVFPPKGHLAELREYKDKYPDFSMSLNTFGFGYNLDSELLLSLAAESGGTFAFIPDAVIVGTTFVNSISNALSTFTQTATLSLCPSGNAKFAGNVIGFGKATVGSTAAATNNDSTSSAVSDENNGTEAITPCVTEESWGRAVNLGPLQLGQTREVVVPMSGFKSGKQFIEAVLTFPQVVGAKTKKFSSARVCGSTASFTSTLDASVGSLRSEVVANGWHAIREATSNKGKRAVTRIDKLATDLKQRSLALKKKHNLGSEDGRTAALRGDLEGRLAKALQGQDRFNRWGKHYLRALTRAHQVQQCTNFMDPGLQVYGGEKFRENRDAGDAIFLSLPAPKRNVAKSSNFTQSMTVGSSARNRSPSPNMATYYGGCGGGCFSGSCFVDKVHASGDEARIPLKNVKAGDSVKVADGTSAKVVCVVRIARAKGKDLVIFDNSGLMITPRHPIHVSDVIKTRWRLPIDLAGVEKGVTAVEQSEDHYVYNLLLEEGKHSLLVNNVSCATWGHGLSGEGIEHAFFGDYNKVSNALRIYPGYKYGFVSLDKGGLLGRREFRERSNSFDLCRDDLVHVSGAVPDFHTPSAQCSV